MTQPPQNKTIRLWHYYNGPQQDAFNALVREFNDTVGKTEGITVEASGQGNVTQLAQAVVSAAQQNAGADTIPHIFAAYSDTALLVDELGLVASLDSYITPQQLDQFVPGYIEEGRFDLEGNLKIFPIAKSTELMYLNATDWQPFADATGVQLEELSTLEGVTAVAKRYYEWTDSLTPQPDDGKAFFGRDSMSNYMLIGSKQLGTPIVSVTGGSCVINLDTTVLRKLWDNYYVPYVNGWFAHYARFRSDDVKTGDLIALVGSTSGSLFFPTQVTRDDNSSYGIEMAVLPAPRFKGSDTVAVQQGAGLVVSKSDTETERACVRFLLWLTGQEHNLRFALTSGYLPVTKEASTEQALDDFIVAHPDLSIPNSLEKSLETALRITQTHDMYTPKAFNNGNAVRTLLETSLIEKAEADRAAVDTMVADGTPRAQAVAQVVTDANFKLWLADLTTQLNKTLNR